MTVAGIASVENVDDTGVGTEDDGGCCSPGRVGTTNCSDELVDRLTIIDRVVD